MSLQTMQIGDTRPIIDRNYRDITKAGQWLRECKVNADQAGAKNIHFGVEWQGVAGKRVYRRYVADDGCGMGEAELDSFMRTYGGGGKVIGGAHDNFGIGAKIALLPWNAGGLLVISYKEGVGKAILLQGDERHYGARPWADGRTVAAADGLSLPEFGINDVGAIWRQVPCWATRSRAPRHGTIFLLLGTHVAEDTVLGDPNHDEGASPFFAALYLNSRLWQTPPAQKVTVDLPYTRTKSSWTRRDPGQVTTMGQGTLTGTKQIGFGRRNVYGAKHYIDRGGKYAVGGGSILLGDGVKAHWFLREQKPEKRDNPYGPRAGFIAVLYGGELYDLARSEDTRYRYRQFGVSSGEVMERLFIVIEPPAGGPHGVYPTSGRDRLLASAGQALPFASWGAAFHESMPDAIAEAVAEALEREAATDSSWKEKMLRYLPRLTQVRLRLVCPDEAGKPRAGAASDFVPPVAACDLGGEAPALVGSSNPPGPSGQSDTNDDGKNASAEQVPEKVSRRSLNVSDRRGRARAREERLRASIPSYRAVSASEMEHDHILASWDPEYRNPDDGSVGCVLLNKEHIALLSLVEDVSREYKVTRSRVADWRLIESVIWEVLGQSLVAKVMHVQAVIAPLVAEDEFPAYLADVALTTAGLGMIGEQQMLQQKLGGILGRKKTQKATAAA